MSSLLILMVLGSAVVFATRILTLGPEIFDRCSSLSSIVSISKSWERVGCKNSFVLSACGSSKTCTHNAVFCCLCVAERSSS